MVSRLIKNQQVGVEKKELGHLGTDVPAATELSQRTGEVGFGEAQAGKDSPCLMFDIITAG